MNRRSSLLAGPAATAAANRLRDTNERVDAWPYAHLFPPPGAVPVNETGMVAVPAAGNSVDVLSYQVPPTMRFILQAILQDYSQAAFQPGDTLWSVVVNPLAGEQANPVQGLIAKPFPLGSWRYGTVWRFAQPYEFDANDLVTSVATNVNLGVGAANQYISGFLGYLLPEV